jgi:hypothetical protein
VVGQNKTEVCWKTALSSAPCKQLFLNFDSCIESTTGTVDCDTEVLLYQEFVGVLNFIFDDPQQTRGGRPVQAAAAAAGRAVL